MAVSGLYWRCLPCGWDNSVRDRFCRKCGRAVADATDEDRWERFLAPEPLITRLKHAISGRKGGETP